MSHQSEIENKKYRNWVKGGLACKYLKQGLESFADDVVKQEHRRILAVVKHTPGTRCNHCCFRNLQPIHTCKRDYNGKKICPHGLFNCNCLHGKKLQCPSYICGAILEEILKSHGSTPPTPNWANTDIQKWCTESWEVAKCFINAPGYSDKTKAADIDISGLLHVFINNINLHSHLACSMAGKNLFIKVRDRRNKLFHSASMEIEEREVAGCIDDIVEILEDAKELRGRPEAQEAVNKLKQLKESKFVITTNDEVDVCKEAILFVSQKSDEFKQMVEDGKNEVRYIIDQKTVKAKEGIQQCQNNAVKKFNKHSKILIKKVKKLETNVPDKVEQLKTDISERVEKVESDISVLKADVSSVKEQMTSLESKVRELDSKRQIYQRHFDFVKGKQELQVQLVKYYKEHYVKTSLSPLKQQEDDINIKDVYVNPEIEVMQEKNIEKTTPKKPGKRYIQGYHEIFQTKEQRHKKIYILGDVGTGKSTFCKMMIESWCNAVSGRTNESVRNENDRDRSESVSSDINMAKEFDDVCQMGQYEFLFFIPLQYMSVMNNDVTVDMIKELTRDLTSDIELVDRIFQEDSMRCLIIIDSLDEWTPPKNIVRKQHVSQGIPNGDRAKEATVLTLSRPSAKGILNLKNSEIDLKLQILGISSSSLKSFIERYISITASTKKSYNDFITIMKRKQIGHIEKTPLLLQQILWLYCNDMELGKSVSETYCQILNIMCGWSDHKSDGNNVRNDAISDKNIFLPENMQKYPRLRNNQRVLFLMGATAFDILTSGSIRNIFGRQHLLENGLSADDVTKLLKFGIFKESICFDPTQEDTQLSFIHMSYLEFFAALYVTSHDNIKETKCLREKGDKRLEVIEKLFGTCKSASDILQLSNVVKMVCGLSPTLIGDLSKQISCMVNKDAYILYLRKHGYKMGFRNDAIIQIQRLLVNCLKECGSFDKTMISISDLCINDIEPSPCLQNINSDDVISLSFEDITSKHVVDYITQCKQLQHVYIKNVSFSYKELSFLSQLECVKQLALRRVNAAGTLQPGVIYLTKLDVIKADNLQPGIIDLSSQKQLQILEIISCMNIRISDLVTEHLEQVYIKDCPNVLDFKHLSNAIRLTDVYIETYNSIGKTCFGETDHERHIIDMSRQNHLRTLTLVNYPGIVVTGLNVEQLEEVYIHHNYEYNNSKDTKLLSYASKTMELLVKDHTISEATLIPLLQKTTLRQATLDNVKCYQEKHLHIDLSGQNHLKKLMLVESPGIVITGLNTEQLEHVHIDNSNHYLRCYASIPALEFELLSSARKLIELHLGGQSVNRKTSEILEKSTLRQLNLIHVYGDQHDIHVDLSKLNHLQILKLSDCKNIKISGINTEQLEKVHILNCQCVFDFDISSNACKLSEIHLEGLTGNIASLVSLAEQASLRQLSLKDVTQCLSDVKGQTHEIHVDLSKQNHLQILELSDCKNIKISGFNTEQLEKVHIINCICAFDFDLLSNARKLSKINLQRYSGNIASLVSLVEHTSLIQLTLKDVSHCQPNGEGQTHEIHVDLSKQNHLQILKLTDCKKFIISGINSERLETLCINNCIYAFEFDLLPKASKLRTLFLQGVTFSTASLVSFVELVSLRQLALKGDIYCELLVENQTHEKRDLSTPYYLVNNKLSDCRLIEISGLNTEQPEKVYIIDCKYFYDADARKRSSNARKLLSNAREISEIKMKSLTCNIASLVLLVQHAFLRRLTLNLVTHCQSEVEGQTQGIHVDLSKQKHLQILELSDCKNIKISGLNTGQLKKVHINNCVGVFDFDLLSNACKLSKIHLQCHTGNIASLVSLVDKASLRKLALIGVTHCQPDGAGQTHEIHVDLSKQNHLRILELTDCKNIKISGFNT